jgi:hypothetical protein
MFLHSVIELFMLLLVDVCKLKCSKVHCTLFSYESANRVFYVHINSCLQHSTCLHVRTRIFLLLNIREIHARFQTLILFICLFVW